MKPVCKTALALARCEQGVAYIEFAFCLPVLLIMFLGSIEVTRYLLIVQKLEKTVSMLTDVTTQVNPNTGPITATQMSQMFGTAQDMMNPYTFGSSGFVVLTDVTQAGSNNPIVNWQYCGGGTLSAHSAVSGSNSGSQAIGQPATLPSGFSMIAGEEVVIGEIFYAFTPVTTQNAVKAQTLYRTAVFMPRLGALTGFSSTCP